MDYYKVETTQAGVLELNVESVPDGLYLYVEVYTENNDNSRAKQGQADSNQSITMDAGAFPAGTYYIKVYAYSNKFSDEAYKLLVTFDAQDEGEMNNDFDEATSLTFGTPITATIRSAKDEDFYKVTNDVWGVLEVEIPETPDDVYIYANVYNTNQDNSRLIQEQVEGGQSLKFAVGPVEPGEHYIKIDGYSSSSSADPYVLTVKLNTTDANEPNGGYSSATPATFGQSYTGTLYAADDEDFYKVTMAQTGQIKVNIPKIPDDVYTYVTIYKGNTTSVVGNDQKEGGLELTCESDVNLPAGDYFVKVDAYSSNHSPEPYEITITQQ